MEAGEDLFTVAVMPATGDWVVRQHRKTTFFALIAQRIEQYPTEVKVGSSNLSKGTITSRKYLSSQLG